MTFEEAKVGAKFKLVSTYPNTDDPLFMKIGLASGQPCAVYLTSALRGEVIDMDPTLQIEVFAF